MQRAGNVVADGQGINGIFTEHLMKSIDKSGLKIEDVFKETALVVHKVTNGKQVFLHRVEDNLPAEQRQTIQMLHDLEKVFVGKKVLGVVSVKSRGGTVLVQDPDTAEADIMPKAAQRKVDVDYVVWLDQIGPKLWDLTRNMVKQK